MADTDLDSTYGVVDKRIGRGLTGASVLTENANLGNITLMRARLTALNGTYYTAARLNQMTRNDMTMALRIASDSAGI